jgi:hypothetical protein
MAFKGMTERFEAKMDDIYGRYSNREPNRGNEPYIEIKPNDPDRNDTSGDTRFGAAASTSYRRDLTRLRKFIGSGDGALFLVRQAELQTGNTFSETRIINPLFVLGNVPGVTRVRRSLGSASGLSPDGPAAQTSGGVDGRIGSAGRLQRKTKEQAIIGRIGGKGPTGLLNLFPPNKLTRAVSGLRSVFGSGENGVLAVNDRPEIDFDGQFFSIAVWRGFRSQGQVGNPLDQAGAELRRGNIRGAINKIGQGINQVIRGTQAPNRNLAGNERGNNDTSLNGWRYFVIDKNDADKGVDRYINNMITFKTVSNGVTGQDGIMPVSQERVLKRTPKKLQGADVQPLSAAQYDIKTVANAFFPTSGGTQQGTNGRNPGTSPNRTAQSNDKAKKQEQAQRSSFWRKVGNAVGTVGRALFGSDSVPRSPIDALTRQFSGQTPDELEPNPGRALMTYPDLSIQSRYEQMLESMKPEDTVEGARDEWWQKFDKLTQERTFGRERRTLNFAGGFKPGDTMPDDIGSRNIKFSVGRGDGSLYGRYFHDASAEILTKGFLDSKGDNQPTDEEVSEIRKAMGDTTDFMFYDFINKVVVPFKAFLTDVNESISPNVSEQQYIGRIERNIVYVGVVREVSFSFRVQAFHPQEMRGIWNKINFLTGMTFPSTYSNGFIVPPFLKLTIGNLFVDQPGYIKSLSYKFDDDGWEIDPNYQAPMGVTVNVSFSIIEKRQMRTGNNFYPYGRSRTPAPTPAGTPARPAAASSPSNSTTPGKLPSSTQTQTTRDGKKATGPAAATTRPPARPATPPDNTRVTPKLPPKGTGTTDPNKVLRDLGFRPNR